MWKSDGPLIQVAIGPGVGAESGATGQAAAPQAPSDQRLNAIIDAARAQLQASGITLPAALIRADDQLAPNTVTIYAGIQAQSAQVTTLDEIAPLLVAQVEAMSSPALDPNGVRTVLAGAVASVAAGDYPQALAQNCRAYYQSVVNSYQAQTAQSLADAGNVAVRSGEFPFATALLGHAYSLSSSAQFPDSNLNIQIAINLASAQALSNDLTAASASYQAAANTAFAHSNTALFAVALTGWAEASYRSQDYQAAVAALQHAGRLIAAPASSELAGELSQALAATLTSVGERAAGSAPSSGAFDGLKRALLAALAGSVPGSSACELLDVGGHLALTLFGAGYQAASPAFTDITGTGDGIIQNMK